MICENTPLKENVGEKFLENHFRLYQRLYQMYLQVFLVAAALSLPIPQQPFFDFAAFPVDSVHPSTHLPAPHFKKPPLPAVHYTPNLPPATSHGFSSHHHLPAAPHQTHHNSLPAFHHTSFHHQPIHHAPVHHVAHIPGRVVYTPAPVVYTQAPITYNTPQKLKPFTNFVNLTPYRPSTEEEPEEEPEEEAEEEREGKLIVEEERSVEDIAELEVASEEQSNLEDPSREIVIPVEFRSDNPVEEVQTRDSLGPPEKGRTGPGIMHPFVDLGEEVEVVAEEEGSSVESEKLVIEPILITSTEATQSSSSTTSTSTTIRPTAEASSSPQKQEETSSVDPVQTTTTSTSEAPPTTTTSSERMEKLLEIAMDRLKEMEETPESSSDS